MKNLKYITQSTHRVLRCLNSTGWTSLSEIEKTLNISKPAIQKVIESLDEAGIVDKKRETKKQGKPVSYKLTSYGRKIKKVYDELEGI